MISEYCIEELIGKYKFPPKMIAHSLLAIYEDFAHQWEEQSNKKAWNAGLTIQADFCDMVPVLILGKSELAVNDKE